MTPPDTRPLGRHMLAERVPCVPHDVWIVRNRQGQTLGMIEWNKRWGCYEFAPERGAVFTHDCLAPLAGFVGEIDP